jgi:cysteine desulfurase
MEHRLPNNLNLSFAEAQADSMLMGMKDVAVSSGSACTSAALEPSYVLKALGLSDERAHSTIRYGLHRFTTEEEVDFTANLTVATVTRLRELSPMTELASDQEPWRTPS